MVPVTPPRKSRLRRALTLLLIVIALLVGAGFVLGAVVFPGPGYTGPASAHFDGSRFVNQPHPEMPARGSFFAWQLDREPGQWPDPFDAPPGPKPLSKVARGALRVTFVNHSTFLIQMDGVNVLLDPIWSERTSPVSWAGPKRVRPPGLLLDDLPRIDAVLISHDHYDHLDVATLERLALRHDMPILVGLGVNGVLEQAGIRGGVDLDWWEGRELAPGVRAVFVPAQHFSGRGLTDRDKSLWGGWVLTGPAGVVYYAGDTGYGPHFDQVRERFGAPRLAILPIGAFKPEWFMGLVHVSPVDAVRAHRVLSPTLSVAAHFGTFRLADDGFREPVDALTAALLDQGVPSGEFVALAEGVALDVPAARP